MISKIQAKSQCPSQAKGAWSWSWHQLDSGERSFGVIRYLWQAIVWTKRPSRLQVGLGESPWYVGTASGPGAPSLPPRVNKEHTWCLCLLSRFLLISKHLHITTIPQRMIKFPPELSVLCLYKLHIPGFRDILLKKFVRFVATLALWRKWAVRHWATLPQPTKHWALPTPGHK